MLKNQSNKAATREQLQSWISEGALSLSTGGQSIPQADIPEADGSMPEDIDPTAAAIAEMLDIDLSGVASGEEASELIVETVGLILDKLQELSGEDDSEEEDEEHPHPEDEEEPEQIPQQQQIAASFSPLMLSMAAENRSMKIDALTGNGNISPATATRLKKRWCNENALSLALSSEGEDGFSFDMETYAKNGKVVQLGERTGAQGNFQLLGSGKELSLSGDEIRDPKRNPLLADAESRTVRN